MDEKTYFKYSVGIGFIFIAIIMILVISVVEEKLSKQIKGIYLLLFLSTVSMTLFLYWINAMKLPPSNDQQLINEMAIALKNNYISNYMKESQYLFLYPYQIGITILVFIIYKIFGENFLYVQYVNCVCSIINMFLLYFISKKIFRNNDIGISRMLSILIFMFSFYFMFYNVHIYGNIIGLTFSLISVLFFTIYLNNEKLRYSILSAIFISISVIIKSNYLIFLCGFILCMILDAIKKKKLKLIIPIIIFIMTYEAVSIGFSCFVKYGLGLDLAEGTPMICYVYMGISDSDDSTPGWFNNTNVKLYSNSGYNNEITKEMTANLIKERLHFFILNPFECIRFFSVKLASTKLNPTFQTIWISYPGARYKFDASYAHYISYHAKALSMLDGKIYNVEEVLFESFEIIVFIFAGIGIYKLAKNKEQVSKYTLAIIFIGGFIFHCIWETKSIYVIQYYYLLLPYTAFGIKIFIENIKMKFEKNERKLLADKNLN